MRAVALTARILAAARDSRSPVARPRADLLPVALVERARARAALGGAHAPRARACASPPGGRARARPPRSRPRRRSPARRRAAQSAKRQRAAAARDVGERVLHARRRRHPRQPQAGRVDQQRAVRRARTARGGWSRAARGRRARAPRACAGAPRRAGGSRACSCRRRTCPTSACVRPGASRARSAAHAPAVAGGEHDRLRARWPRTPRPPRATGSRARSPFVQTIRTSTPPAARERDEALEPAEVEVHVERRRDQAQVDVGGQRLLARVVVGAREQRAPRQHVADRLAVAQRDPVARRRAGRRGRARRPPARPRRARARRCRHRGRRSGRGALRSRARGRARGLRGRRGPAPIRRPTRGWRGSTRCSFAEGIRAAWDGRAASGLRAARRTQEAAAKVRCCREVESTKRHGTGTPAPAVQYGWHEGCVVRTRPCSERIGRSP